MSTPTSYHIAKREAVCERVENRSFKLVIVAGDRAFGEKGRGAADDDEYDSSVWRRHANDLVLQLLRLPTAFERKEGQTSETFSRRVRCDHVELEPSAQ